MKQHVGDDPAPTAGKLEQVIAGECGGESVDALVRLREAVPSREVVDDHSYIVVDPGGRVVGLLSRAVAQCHDVPLVVTGGACRPSGGQLSPKPAGVVCGVEDEPDERGVASIEQRHARVKIAAANNAAWCDAMCRSHGHAGTFTPQAWLSPKRTPELYPDAVTLAADAAADPVLAGIDTRSGCSVKDSFAALDLTTNGFERLFDAWWLWRPPGEGTPEAAPMLPIGAADLAAWAQAWCGSDEPRDVFRPSLVAGPDVVVLGRRNGTRFVAGAIANVSGTATGLSNVFAVDRDLDAAWAGALATIVRRWPDLPIVGYERDDAMAAPLRLGFTATGPLTVWLHR